MGKSCNYPLAITQGDRFASCENIVSRSQTSSFPPPPLTRADFKLTYRENCGSYEKHLFLEGGGGGGNRLIDLIVIDFVIAHR